MRKKRKKLRIFISIIILLAILLIIVNNIKSNNENSGEKITTTDEYSIESSKLREKTVYKGITVDNVEINLEGDSNEILVNLKNENAFSTKSEEMTIYLLDKNKNKLAKFVVVVPEIFSKESIQISASTTKDISKAFSYIIE